VKKQIVIMQQYMDQYDVWCKTSSA